MHQHIIINHDLGLHIVIYSRQAEVDLLKVLDEMILLKLTNATEGIQKT